MNNALLILITASLAVTGATLCTAQKPDTSTPTHYEDGSEIAYFDEYIDWKDLVQP